MVSNGSDEDPGSASSPRGFQRRFLRKLGRDLDTALRIGRRGWHEALADELERCFARDELVKVRITSDERETVAETIAKACAAHCVGLVGQNALFYRPHPERPTIIVPERASGSDV
ncbi:MAG: YhbY family RNA-binding protein [Planctomycetes bacterium]|nr:YhbY family RNA-binding protein [Planctomycetota bacterium]